MYQRLGIGTRDKHSGGTGQNLPRNLAEWNGNHPSELSKIRGDNASFAFTGDQKPPLIARREASSATCQRTGQRTAQGGGRKKSASRHLFTFSYYYQIPY
jgi:hypothetical protein